MKLRDCLIVTDVVLSGILLTIYAEKNPKLKVVKDNIKKIGKDFFVDCKELGKSLLDAIRKDEKIVQSEV